MRIDTHTPGVPGTPQVLDPKSGPKSPKFEIETTRAQGTWRAFAVDTLLRCAADAD